MVSPGLVTSKMLPTRGSDNPHLKRVVDTRLWYTQNTTDYFPGDATVLIISVIHRFIIAIM